MKFGKAQYIVLGELIVLLTLESSILNKIIMISRLAFTGSTSTSVTNNSSNTNTPVANMRKPY